MIAKNSASIMTLNTISPRQKSGRIPVSSVPALQLSVWFRSVADPMAEARYILHGNVG